MLSPLDATDMKHSLDDLLLRVSPIFRKCQVLQSQISLSLVELRELRESVMLVDREFALWPARQAEEWMPKSIGLVAKGGVLGDTTYSPTHADTYFDGMSISISVCLVMCLANQAGYQFMLALFGTATASVASSFSTVYMRALSDYVSLIPTIPPS